jgi:hypothetical protein
LLWHARVTHPAGGCPWLLHGPCHTRPSILDYSVDSLWRFLQRPVLDHSASPVQVLCAWAGCCTRSNRRRQASNHLKLADDGGRSALHEPNIWNVCLPAISNPTYSELLLWFSR